MVDITSKNIAILVDNYFEQAEFSEPKKAVEEAGMMATIVSTGENSLQAMQGDVDKGDTFMADITIDDVDFGAYDMLIIPGGAVNADKLRMNEKARDWVRYCMENDIPMAAICHAPWLLASADIIDGVKLTSFFTLQDDMRNAGADWSDEEVVVDSNLITSRNPDDLPAFCKMIVDHLQQAPVSAA